MQIHSLTLENIKSYTKAEIVFSSGLNAICGHNGSGKTTILEAIGFALFDYVPYSQKNFLRAGEKHGVVRVRLLARDGRLYEVARRVPGGFYYVYDVELKEQIATKAENVKDWLRTTGFGLDEDVDLTALFKNAVGVPQGAMTADFLQTGQVRKRIFGPLLQVEEYEAAWSELSDSNRYLEQRESLVKQEMARLEAEVERIAEVRAAEAALLDGLQRVRGQLASLQKELTRLEAELRAFDQHEVDLSTLRLHVEERRGVVALLEQQTGQLVEALQRSREAEERMRATQAGADLFIQAQQKLQVLEEQRKQRDLLMRAQSDAVARLREANGHIEALDRQIREAEAAAEGAIALDSDVARQLDLETRLAEMTQQLGALSPVEHQLTRTRREQETARTSLEGLQSQLTAARAAGEKVARLEAVRGRRRELEAEIAALRPLEAQEQELREKGTRLRAQHDALQTQVERLPDLQRRLAEHQALAESLPDLQVDMQTRREQRVHAQATLEYHRVAAAELQRDTCPLLEVRCPVVAADGTVVTLFGEKATTLAQRVRVLDGEISDLERRLTAAQAATAETRSLSEQIARIEPQRDQLQRLDDDLLQCRASYKAVSTQVSVRPKLEAQLAALQTEERILAEAERAAARLPVLEEGVRREETHLEELRRMIAGLEEQRRGLLAVQMERAQLEQDLQNLHDPRTRRQSLLGRAERLPELQALQLEAHNQAERAGDQLKAYQAQLFAFIHLDADLAHQTELRDRHQSDYTVYEQSKAEAALLVERERAVSLAEKELAAARHDLQVVERERDIIAARYNADRHQELRKLCGEMGQDVARTKRDEEHCAEQLQTVQRELARLARQEEKLAGKSAELAELQTVGSTLKFVRETIRNAGPAVTEHLLRNISYEASTIFADIMDDHAVELIWNTDYEVHAQYGAEQREFAQLSGGEQMCAALALRLALLKEISQVDFAFFDEPTQNMDGERRVNLAAQIRAVKGFEQLIVISHDDTFEHHTDTLIRLYKENEETIVEN